MTWLRRPAVWFPLLLLLFAAGGSELLRNDQYVHLSERDRGAYGLRPAWQARFDALSATCGVGLLTYRLDEDYTALGRWVLAGLGVVGALLYLMAARQLVTRFWPDCGTSLPRGRTIAVAFLALQAGAIVVLAAAERLSAGRVQLGDAAWNAIATFSSLGWFRPTASAHPSWLYALVAFVSALGWTVWFLGAGRARRHLLATVATYVLFLLTCAAIIAALEVPRGAPRGERAPGARLAETATIGRFSRSLMLVTCASGSGQATEELTERSVSDGTKLMLGVVALVGGLGGSCGGGLKWTLALGVLAAAAALLRPSYWWSADDNTRRCLLAAVAVTVILVLFAGLTALGLLIIEGQTGSAFQRAPSFADAFLDAASAVGGAGLTSGVTATVTSLNLSSGIGHGVDEYQYGMAWLMLAMFIGRVAPVWVLTRLAGRRWLEAPALPEPLI